MVEKNIKNIDEIILFAIEKISQINKLLLWNIVKTEKISPIQIQFIDYINKMPLETTTVSNLAEEFELKKSTVSDSVNSLINKGYLERIQDHNDKRVFYFKLTEKTKEKLGILNKKNDIFRNIIKNYSFEQKEEVVKFFLDLMNELYEEKIIQPAKMCLTCNNFIKDYNPGDSKPHYCKLINKYVSIDEIKIHCNSYTKKSEGNL